ncbi:hypothetical protein [Microlunatus antarcticus]|uniref:Helix-turn-helix domain-containing protein n=1 Tax=Microlunatus antarcticus TaxID=53388 RepID=A0A7W5JSG0_9ACTN|nr:hypothetical protein [Microlunatus antarcticus]MBB3325494.1 hypothetical protein [Microlunatus antarcticus]
MADTKARNLETGADAPMWLKAVELAARHACSVGTLANLRAKRQGVPFVHLPGVGIRYAMDDVLAWEAAAREPVAA